MSARTRLRGQPVLALVLVLGGWVALRAAFWESPFADAVARLPGLIASPEPAGRLVAEAIDALLPSVPRPPGDAAARDLRLPVAQVPAVQLAEPALAMPAFEHSDRLRPVLAPAGPTAPVPQRLAAAHTMLMLSGLSAIPLPAELAELLANPARPDSVPYQPLARFAPSVAGSRWSADGWVLLRRDTTTALTSGRGSYGRSQAGAVLRYALAPASAARPAAYARVSRSLDGPGQGELALGLSARPVPGVPLRAAAEVRATRSGEATLLRPAAFAVTELAPLALPLGFSAEAYGQAGYVGGRYASAFADGQVRAERALADLGKARFSAGGGAWGGAQKGAARLDIGPSASLRLRLGAVGARASMDWRFRVAGDAQPASGPTLTIAAGF